MVRGGRFIFGIEDIIEEGADPLPVPGQEELPDWLSKLEKALPGSGGFAVGSKAGSLNRSMHFFHKSVV